MSYGNVNTGEFITTGKAKKYIKVNAVLTS